MASDDIFDIIERERETGRAFCVATVLRTADATSAKAGAKALVTEDGEVIGHMGGACVRRALKTAAAEALESDAPTMIRVKPSDKVVALQDSDGAALYKSGCPSGGTVELLIEAYRPAPILAVIGATLIAEAIAAHASLMRYQMLRSDTGELDVELSARDCVVVASQGSGDMEALRHALVSGAGFVSMVASKRKAATLKDRLVKKGLDASLFDRLKSPAGINVAAVDPHEIAISIVAEIVQVQRRVSVGKAQVGHG